MPLNQSSSAPHLFPAKDWRSHVPNGDLLVLHKTADDAVEVGIRRWTAGKAPHAVPRDMLCYFQSGHGAFRGDNGETIAVEPGTVVHFKQGWNGEIDPAKELDASYMICEGGPAERTPVLREVLTASPLKDWGVIPTMIEGTSRTAGILLSREANGRAESGIWTCTPGIWRCEVTSDEYCHFLDGSCTYTHESGERIEIAPDTLAFFPRGWKGTCHVRRTMRKVYMIR